MKYQHIAAHLPSTAALVAATALLAVSALGAPSARAATSTLAAYSDANLTGTTVNADGPYSYGIVVNAYDNTQGVVDFSLASIPINASLTAAQFNFRQASYTSSSGPVVISAYGRTGAYSANDASTAATTAGAYNPAFIGLGAHSVDFTTTGLNAVQSILGTTQHLGLRFTGTSGTNASFASVEQASFSTPPSFTATYAIPTNPTFYPRADANITNGTVNTYPADSYGIVTNVFNSTQGVLDYSFAGIPTGTPISAATFTFDETSTANQTSAVSIYAYSRSGAFSGTETSQGALVGTYNAVDLGLGLHSIALPPAAVTLIQSLLGTSQDLGLRFAAASSDTNTSLASLEESPGFTAPSLTLAVAVPEPASLALLGLSSLILLTRRRH